MNLVPADMLGHFVNPQDNWDTLLRCAKFAISNTVSSATNNTPFRLNFGQNPFTPLSMVASSQVPAAVAFVKSMHASLKAARQCLQRAQERMREVCNESHRPQTFEIGQMVLLKTVNLHLKGGLAKKLLPKYVGPCWTQQHVLV